MPFPFLFRSLPATCAASDTHNIRSQERVAHYRQTKKGTKLTSDNRKQERERERERQE